MRSSQSFVQLVVCAMIGLVAATGTLPAQGPSQDHQYSTADIQTGSRLYSAQCQLCHGVNGDGIAGINLRQGQFRRPMSDDDLRKVIATGNPGAGMPPFKLEPAELDGLVAFIRAGFEVGTTVVRVAIGDAGRGQALFEGKGACATCHRVKGKGPRLAPDLTDIGAVRSPSVLQRSLIEPTKAMLPINRPVRIVTRDGRTIRGRRLNEDTFTVQLIDDQERLLSLTKAELREFELGTTSLMPSATKTLTSGEVADVVAYLLTLTGQP